MIYPSIAELSDEGVNRYALSIATAKSARRITDEQLAKLDCDGSGNIDSADALIIKQRLLGLL